MLGVISKTRQGCEVLKQYGWDAVRHSRRTLWPVTPEEVDAQLTAELSSVPSTLSLNSESTSSRHNSESESQPSTLDLLGLYFSVSVYIQLENLYLMYLWFSTIIVVRYC